MLIVFDQMNLPDNPDNPYYAGSAEDAPGTWSAVTSDKFRKEMENYGLTEDMDAQLVQKRAWSRLNVSGKLLPLLHFGKKLRKRLD